MNIQIILAFLCLQIINSIHSDPITSLNQKMCKIPLDNGPILAQMTEPFDYGEAPHWDVKKKRLFFVDIHKSLVNSYNPQDKSINSLHLEGGDVTPVIPVRNTNNEFLVGIGRKLSMVHWDYNVTTSVDMSQITVLDEVDNDKPKNRFNGGKADTKGRPWIGTIGYEDASGVQPDQASLFRFSGPNLTNVEKVISPVTNSNGLAWNKENNIFYYIDTPTRLIAAYDFDEEKGTITNRRVAFDLTNYDIGGSPGGMTIDTDGNLWIALYGGGAVIKVDPNTSTLLSKTALPAQYVTSVMFGGDNLDTLFVTTSRFGLSPEALAAQPAAGAIFALYNLNTQGFPANTAVVK